MKRKAPSSINPIKDSTSSAEAKAPKRAKPRQGNARGKVFEPEVLPAEDLEETEPDSESAESPEVNEEDAPSEQDIQASLPAKLNSEIEVDVGRSVGAHDPLAQYLAEVRRYPMLETEEEFKLARQMNEKGDIQAAKALVSANLRLVVKIAMEYRSMYSNLLDLIQEGNIGLMKAVSKFDPAKGARLGYYASWWIRSYILKYLLDNFRLVKIGTTQAQKKLFYHLVREKERLEAQGLLAGPKLLAETLNVREKDVIEMEQRLSGRGSEVSLDTPMNPESQSGASHMDLLVDATESADEALAKAQMLRLLSERLPEFEKTLNEKERQLLRDRLLAEEPKTLQEVADRYGLTRERARQIEAKVVQKLREFLRPSL